MPNSIGEMKYRCRVCGKIWNSEQTRSHLLGPAIRICGDAFCDGTCNFLIPESQTTTPVEFVRLEIEVVESVDQVWEDMHGNFHPKFIAQIKDRPGHFAFGKSGDEAIGELLRCNQGLFQVKIKLPEPKV